MTSLVSPLSTHGAQRRHLLTSLALAGAGVGAGLPAWAQNDWPAGKLITWVVPYPAGGSTDVLGRNIALKLGAALSTNVIVDNKAGATGTIGAAYVAKAAPDGLTLLGTSIGPQAIAPHLMAKLPYDHITAFEPVITVGTIPHILVVGSNQPFKTVADLLAAAKAQPGKLAFASGGNGTILQMQGELLQQQTGARFIHVPYKGDTPRCKTRWPSRCSSCLPPQPLHCRMCSRASCAPWPSRLPSASRPCLPCPPWARRGSRTLWWSSGGPCLPPPRHPPPSCSA